jgi:hypothetical protein
LFYLAVEAVIGMRGVGKTKASGRGTVVYFNQGRRLVLENQQVQVGFQALPYPVLRRSRLAKAALSEFPETLSKRANDCCAILIDEAEQEVLLEIISPRTDSLV